MMPKLSCTLFILLTFTFYNYTVLGNNHLSKLLLKSNSKEFSNPSLCIQEATCEPIQNATCFGTVLPYSVTSLALADDSESQLEVQDNLALWQGLRSVPRCWAVIQPLLCAIYMPKCENGSLSLPSQEMCRITRGPCKAVEAKHTWPSFLRCENKKVFPPGCRNPLQEVKFNTSSQCISPLVETDNSDNWYDGVEGCGVQCQNPLFTKEEHETVHYFIKVMASIGFATTLFAVLTFLISWKAANRYPAIIIFYINVCLLVVSFGWLIQFFPGAREEIVCLHDGTVRRRQPRSGEHLCSITFVLIYSFLMAALVWFVILAYAWHVLFQQSGAPKDIVKKKVAYFHLSAWCIPLVLTTIIMAMKEVDGDSISGICFVGYANTVMRVGFLLVPVAAAAFIGGPFLAGGLYTLIKVKLSSQEVANGQVKGKIHHMIWKLGIFTTLALFFVFSTFACHVYEFIYKTEWEENLREYIVCLATASASSHSSWSQLPNVKCVLKNRPSLFVVYFHLILMFGFAIGMSSWVWTRATIESWRRFFYRLCEPSENKALAVKRHQLIAKAFQHRHEINQGHLSFSLNSTHEDPVGMNFEVNSTTSREVSSAWAAALPQFLARRGAVAGVGTLALRQYSSASDISQRRISLDSYHQQNLDSLSLQMSEQEYVAHALRHQRRKTRKERERFLRANRIAPWFPGRRRGSDTSIQSSIIAASVAAAVKRVGVKVTKATSTGDLNAEILFPRPASSAAVNCPLIHNRPQRQALPPPIFSHGMADNSHCFSANNRKKQPETGGFNANQNFNPSVPGASTQSAFTPMYGQGYNLMPQMPLGYLGLMMYPPANGGLFPGYLPTALPGSVECGAYGPMPYLPYGQYPVPESLFHQYQQPIIPLHPTVDSASETEYLPIILSDSEFTDGGHRSYDEAAQLLSAQRLLQEHTQQIAPQYDRLHPRPMLEPQSCAKTQFLKKIDSATSVGSKESDTHKLEYRAPSGRKSPHIEAPPPSPADSERSFVDDEEEERFTNQQMAERTSRQSNQSSTSALLCKGKQLNLPSSENILQRIKSKIKRAASFTHDSANGEAIEMNLKSSRMSLRCPSNHKPSTDSGSKSSFKTLQQNSPSAECPNSLESSLLIATGGVCENISR